MHPNLKKGFSGASGEALFSFRACADFCVFFYEKSPATTCKNIVNIVGLWQSCHHQPDRPPCRGTANGFRNGTPTSITFTGKIFGEAEMLALARAYQEIMGWQKVHPEGF